MSDDLKITVEYFERRFAQICLRSGLSGLPKGDKDQHILLKSMVLAMGNSGTFSEKEIDEKLKTWLKQVSRIQNLDHVTLRRWLIDTGYLTRSKDGATYQVARPGPCPQLFEDLIDQLDIGQLVIKAQEEMALKKREALERG